MKKFVLLGLVVLLTACGTSKLSEDHYTLSNYKVKGGNVQFSENEVLYKIKLNDVSSDYMKLSRNEKPIFFSTEDAIYKKSSNGVIVDNVDIFVEGLNPFNYVAIDSTSFHKLDRMKVEDYKEVENGITVSHLGVDYFLPISKDELAKINKKVFPSKDKNDLVLEFNDSCQVSGIVNSYYTLDGARLVVDMTFPLDFDLIEVIKIDDKNYGRIIDNDINYLFELGDYADDIINSNRGGVVFNYKPLYSKAYTDNVKRTIEYNGELIEYYKLYDQDFVEVVNFE